MEKVELLKVGKRIREARDRLGISQEKLGEAVDRSANQIGKYERNRTSPTLETLAKIARTLQVSVVSLIPEEEENEASLSLPVDVKEKLPLWGDGFFDPEAVALPFVEEWDGTMPLPETALHWMVRRRYVEHSKCLITMMKEHDISMRPFLLAGDAMIIDPQVRKPRSQAMVIVRIGGELMVRRYIRASDKGAYAPINPRLPVVLETGKEEVLGQVVGIAGRKFTSSVIYDL